MNNGKTKKPCFRREYCRYFYVCFYIGPLHYSRSGVYWNKLSVQVILLRKNRKEYAGAQARPWPEPRISRDGGGKARLTVIRRQEDAPCLLMNTTYGRIYGVTVPRDYHVLLTLQSCGQTVCTVYERMEKGMWRD